MKYTDEMKAQMKLLAVATGGKITFHARYASGDRRHVMLSQTTSRFRDSWNFTFANGRLCEWVDESPYWRDIATGEYVDMCTPEDSSGWLSIDWVDHDDPWIYEVSYEVSDGTTDKR